LDTLAPQAYGAGNFKQVSILSSMLVATWPSLALVVPIALLVGHFISWTFLTAALGQDAVAALQHAAIWYRIFFFTMLAILCVVHGHVEIFF
jgi:hypothetical protein